MRIAIGSDHAGFELKKTLIDFLGLWPFLLIFLWGAASSVSQAADQGFAFDHSLYANVLRNYTVNGKVDYPSLKREVQDLDAYLSLLAQLSKEDFERMSSREKIAFWLNAYNAITLKVIVDRYPLKRLGIKGFRFPSSSIRQIPGAWSKIKYPVIGKRVTLNEIEHTILRKQFREPRIHMALVCAAQSCPPLRGVPYAGDQLDDQLNDQTVQFLKHPEEFRIDESQKAVYISSIFKWFGKDFISEKNTGEFAQRLSKEEKAVLSFILPYLPPEKATFLSQGHYDIKYLKYDWSLNEKD